MYWSNGTQRDRPPRSRASHVQDSFERLTGERGFSRFDAGRQFESDQAPKSYIRSRPNTQYSRGSNSGFANSASSSRSSKISCTTYTSADERASLKARTAEAVRRDREEQEGGTKFASYFKRGRLLPLTERSPLIEEPWDQHSNGKSASASRGPTRSTQTISDHDVRSTTPSSHSQGQTPSASFSGQKNWISKQAPSARTVDQTKSMANRKGPTFITRDANGNLQSERCLSGKCCARWEKSPPNMPLEKHTRSESRPFSPR